MSPPGQAGGMPSEGDLDDRLSRHLLTVDNQLEDVSEGDPKTMKAVVNRLIEIQHMTTRAIAESSLTTKTASLLRQVASAGTSLAKFMLDARRAKAEVERKMQSQLEDVMARLSLNDQVGSRAHMEPGKRTSKRKHSAVDTVPLTQPGAKRHIPVIASHESDIPTLPAHVARSYKWILQHIYDPFPPMPTRIQIAKETSVPEKTISDWFTNTRRKIGWTGISKKHFNGCRALTVDCARVVLLGESTKVPVCKDLHDAFITMKDKAHRLFEKSIGTSNVANRLEALIVEHTAMEKSRSSCDIPFCLQRPQEVPEPFQRSKETNSRKRRAPDEQEDSAPAPPDLNRRQTKRPRQTSESLSVPKSGTTQSPCLDNVECSEHQSSTRLSEYWAEFSQVASDPLQSRPCKRRLSVDEEVPSAKRSRRLPGSNALKQDPPIFNGAASTRLPPRDGILSDVSLFSDVPPPITSEMTDPVQSVDLFPTNARVSTCCSEGNLATMTPTANDFFYDSTFLPVPGVLQPTVPSADILSLSELFASEDFAELPAMPNFVCDGSDILPPSLDPVPSTSELFITYPPGSNEAKEQHSPTPTAVDDAQPLSSLDFDFPLELQLNPITPDPWTVPACDGALHFCVLPEMPRINKDSWNLLDGQTTTSSFDSNKA